MLERLLVVAATIGLLAATTDVVGRWMGLFDSRPLAILVGVAILLVYQILYTRMRRVFWKSDP